MRLPALETMLIFETTRNMTKPKHNLFRSFYVALAALFITTHLFGQDDLSDDTVFVLSPFEVSTGQDDRYFASNAISGSRLDVRIQDMPLSIEVITSEFVRDTGSTNLRDSLRFSAGIMLQSQNDAFQAGTDNFGGVNNPEGATSAKGDSSFKIRGFVTNNTLRNGFRRQHATDTINIDRVEVVRGPSALLYGVGNFGGVVNYLTKSPLPHQANEVTFGFGKDGWLRSTVDTTGPLPKGFGYRLTAAWEKSDDWTDIRNREHWFISPVLEWNWKKTKLTLDFEVGSAEDRGIGFKSVRAPTLVGVPIFQADRLETYGFLEFEGKNPRTFRWSGPDTYLLTDSWNANIELQQGLMENMFLLVGYNHSNVKFNTRDVFGGISTFTLPTAAPVRARPLLATIEAIQIIDGQNSDVRIPVENAVFQYNWTGVEQEFDWDQVRAEWVYTRKLFEESRWFRSNHSLLLGYSWEKQKSETTGFRTADSPDGFNFFFKNPTDSTPIRFAAPTDGSPELPLNPFDLSGSTAANTGMYAVYSARFYNDRLFLIGGIRRDSSESKDGFYELIGSRQGRIFFDDSKVVKDTSQFGISYEVIDGLNIFALRSEGVEPNFGGQRDGLGRALDSSVAESREVGVKLTLFGGKLAATVSVFKIERSGVPFSYWWAPAPVRGVFRRDDDIVYRMNEWNLDRFPNNPYLATAAAQWEAAKASGALFEAVNAVDGRTYQYLNASTPEGAAYLDQVFSALKAEFAKPRAERTDNDPWAGWLFDGEAGADSNVNFASLDWSSGDFFQSISDESKGWEMQLIWSPTESFQFLFNYSHVKRTVANPGSFVKYPFAEGNWDRWATWYFPNANWGLAGVSPEEAYPGGPAGLPNPDTSTWTGIGWGRGESLDDTPEHAVSWWGMYSFNRDFLSGLQIGLGGNWESKREYASAFTSAGQRKQNETDTTIKAYSDPRLTMNAMVKYTFKVFNEGDTFVQLNVDNFLDDRKQYGLIYAPGISWRLQMGISF